MSGREEPIPALSSGLSHVVLTGLFLVATLPVANAPLPVTPPAVLGPSAAAPERVSPPAAAPSLPSAALVAPSPPPPASVPSVAPREAPSAAPASPGPAGPAEVAEAEPVKDEWPEDEVIRAKEQCMHQLASSPAEYEWLPPIRDGACGLPAPVRLKRLGAVTFKPAVQINCSMVAALDSWIRTTMQPAARERLKSEVVGIVSASGYSCRNIYNRKNARLSQHALANAIDIGGFALANGRTVRVLTGWGLTERDIKALEAKAKAAAETKAAEAKAAEAKAKAEAKSEDTAKDAGKAAAKAQPKGRKGGAVAEASKDATAEAADAGSAGAASAARKAGSDKSVKGSKVAGKGEATTGSAVSKASLTSPVSLPIERRSVVGTVPAAVRPKRPTNEAQFLRALHSGACGAFGTVLGPEANDPHRDHFHLDLIPRRTRRGYCE